jgi:hypothetical protein
MRVLLYILIIIEYISFYYVFFGKRQFGKGKWSKWICLGIDLFSIVFLLNVNQMGLVSKRLQYRPSSAFVSSK